VGFALLFASRYPLTSDVHARLRRVLAVRRNDEPETDDVQQEAQALSRLLIGETSE
jgi:hypothetical protein